MSDLKNNLSKLSSAIPSNWMDDINDMQENLWMDYSSEIARRIYSLIKDDKKLNQEKLANAIGAKPQYISRILKGKENLTLKTIYRLSKALNYQLITFPDYEYSQPISELLKSSNWQSEVKLNEPTKVVPMYYEFKNLKGQ